MVVKLKILIFNVEKGVLWQAINIMMVPTKAKAVRVSKAGTRKMTA